MSRAPILAAAIVAASLAAGPAAAQWTPTREYRLTWTIGPHALPSGDMWVREQGKIVETQLLPTALYVAEGPVAAANGDPLMGRGQQLARLHSDRLAACTVLRGQAGTLSSRMYVCLVDTDGDRRFDAYFQRGGMGHYHLLSLTGEMPERPRPIAAASFREVPPAQMVRPPLLSLHYQRILDSRVTIPVQLDMGSNKIRFHFTAGTGGMREMLSRDCRLEEEGMSSYCASAVLPSRFEFAGLALELLERRGEDLRIRVVAPFGPREVEIMGPGSLPSGGELRLVDEQ